jgi:hypothetical protein
MAPFLPSEAIFPRIRRSGKRLAGQEARAPSSSVIALAGGGEIEASSPLGVILQRALDEGDEVHGVWLVKRDRSPLNDFPNVSLITVASDGTDLSSAGTLQVTCLENETRLVVGAANMFLLDDDGTVEVVYRLDDLPAVKQRWPVSASNRAAGRWGRSASEPLMREMIGHKKMFLQITERDGDRHRATFLLDGYDSSAPEIAGACGWSLPPQE